MGHYNHPRQNHRPYVLKDKTPVACPNCGAMFVRTHNTQYKCNPLCVRQPTAEQKLIVERYKAKCRMYYLPIMDTFRRIAMTDPTDFCDLIKPRAHLSMSKQKRDRLLMILTKFCDDIENGWYHVTKRRLDWLMRKWIGMTHNGYTYRIRRAKHQLQKHCPRKVPGCIGGYFEGDCPRHWRECEFAQ